MPIHGITDKLILPRLGKIRLGIMKETEQGKKYPAETEYFVVPSEVADIYGDEPTEIPVMFPVDDDEMIFPHYYKWFQGSGLKCKGDGLTAYRPFNLVDDPSIIDDPPGEEWNWAISIGFDWVVDRSKGMTPAMESFWLIT